MQSHTLLLLFFLLPLTAAGQAADGNHIEPRVHKGQKVKLTDKGIFAVQIHYNGKLLCSGSLLSERHVLTSAHCLADAKNTPDAWDDIYVIAGQTKQIHLNSHEAKNRIYRLKIHPKYDKLAYKADIAVALVREPIRYGRIQYAKLCTRPLVAGDVVNVYGYGLNENLGSENNPLLSAKMSIIDLDECRELLVLQLPRNVLCTEGYKKRRTICRGDSGGPLMHNDELCGINTWTYECGNNIMPDIFMSVYHYRDFITQVMNETID